MLKAWFGEDHPQLGTATPAAHQFRRHTYEAVLEAERSLLQTLGFDFSVEVLHAHMARLCWRRPFVDLGLHRHREFHQLIVNLSNDVYTMDGTMLLQYPVSSVAAAGLHFVFDMANASGLVSAPLPTTPQGKPWYAEHVTDEDMAAMTARFKARIYPVSADAQLAPQPAAASSRIELEVEEGEIGIM
jgi:hypothetical protein